MLVRQVSKSRYERRICLTYTIEADGIRQARSRLAVSYTHLEITMDELDLTAAESKATYDEIKAYVLEKFGFKVSQLMNSIAALYDFPC